MSNSSSAKVNVNLYNKVFFIFFFIFILKITYNGFNQGITNFGFLEMPAMICILFLNLPQFPLKNRGSQIDASIDRLWLFLCSNHTVLLGIQSHLHKHHKSLNKPFNYIKEEDWIGIWTRKGYLTSTNFRAFKLPTSNRQSDIDFSGKVRVFLDSFSYFIFNVALHWIS